MCLGIPGQVVDIADPHKNLGYVNVGGVRRLTNLACVATEVGSLQDLVGQWVLVHVGFAMSRIDPAEAERTLQLLAEMGEVQKELDEMRNSGRSERQEQP